MACSILMISPWSLGTWKRWLQQKTARSFKKEQAGKYFDPRALEEFMTMMELEA